MSFLTPIRAVILDLDGTLVDTIGDFHAALASTLIDLQVDPAKADRAFISVTVGRGSEYLVQQTLRHVGLDADDPAVFEGALARYQHHYAHINGTASDLFAGVVEGLAQFKAHGWRMACLTNKPGRFARELLVHKGIAPSFDHVFGGDEFPRKKPDPLPLIETCRTLQLAPSQVLMVGDSLNDAQAGHAVGCPVVLVSYGYNHGRPIREVPAHGYVDRLDQLLSLAGTPGAAP